MYRVTWTVALLLVFAGGCSRQLYHRVRPGDTLYRVSRTYGVRVEDLAAANHLADAGRIEVGQRLLIPAAAERVAARQTPAPVARSLKSAPVREKVVRLSWPVHGGSLTSGFGARGTGRHDGIDVSAPVGTPVFAAADGEVAYTGTLRGYGNLVILRHRGGLSTVYAHNRVNLVRLGQQVRCGDPVGELGNSGHASGANLHFEVRRDNVARDPLAYLPADGPVLVGMRDSAD